MDTLYTVGHFIAQYWFGILVFVTVASTPHLLILWGMATNPDRTMLIFAIIMTAVALWMAGITIELVHLRDKWEWYAGYGVFAFMGVVMMAVGILERAGWHIAFGYAVTVFAGGAFAAPLSLTLYTLTWLVAGMGLATYFALLYIERKLQREETRREILLHQLLGHDDEGPLPGPGLPGPGYQPKS